MVRSWCGFAGGDRGGEVGGGTGVASGPLKWLPPEGDKAPQPVRGLGYCPHRTVILLRAHNPSTQQLGPHSEIQG